MNNRNLSRQQFVMTVSAAAFVAVASWSISCYANSGAGNTSSDQAVETLKKATTYFRSISTNGGYAGIYSLDLKDRYGEALYEPIKPMEIWVQPPPEPLVLGNVF